MILMFGGLFYGMYYLYHRQASQPLEADLIAVDTLQISRLKITSPESEQYVELQRQEAGWIASNGQVHQNALPAPVSAVLQNLLRVTTYDIASTSESEWNKYGLGESQAVRVELFAGKEQVKDFWVGPGSVGEHPPDSLAYLRIEGEKEVYAVKGLQSAPFFEPFSTYRPKTIIQLLGGSRIDSFSYVLADTIHTISRSGNSWFLNRAAITEPTRIDRFIANLREVSSGNFADDFDDHRAGVVKLPSLHLHLSRSEAPVLIDMYLDTLREHSYLLRSTQNPGTWFETDSGRLYQQFFLPLDSLTLKL